MLTVRLHEIDSIEIEKLKYVVIASRLDDQWVYVRHKARDTWEIPGGRIEPSENPVTAAKRELYEETGAMEFSLEAVCDYSVERNGVRSYGRLFLSEIDRLGKLPDMEIVEVRLYETVPEAWTYEQIQPILMRKIFETNK